MDPQTHDLITALRHRLHAHPERSGEEKWTKATLIDFLQAHTRLEVVDCGAWAYAVYHSLSPTREAIAFRADFDALPIADGRSDLPYQSVRPNLSHACGHDGHAAALCGLALYLEATGADRDVYLIFQHAEETGAGGQTCAAFLKTVPVRRVYAMHNMSGFPENSVVVRDGLSQCASEGVTFHFQGARCHASQPEDGRNPALAIAALITASERLIKETTWPGLVLATVVGARIGQGDFGIAAGEGQLSLTLRAEEESALKQLEALLAAEAERQAETWKLEWQMDRCDIFPETRNDPATAAIVREAAAALGLKTLEPETPWRASEDFGWYTKVCPGAIFYIGNGLDHAPLHTPDYDFNDRILSTIVAMFGKIIQLTP